MTLWWLEQDRIKGRPFGEPSEEMVTVWARGWQWRSGWIKSIFWRKNQ